MRASVQGTAPILRCRFKVGQGTLNIHVRVLNILRTIVSVNVALPQPTDVFCLMFVPNLESEAFRLK